ncbi:MAG: hypothetical protein E6G81_04130 [Alphaproteobacteria bacterium]|nr:MAG: hypothetical protein E6G81_04130 [Alphaproteobacteria bacterium]
MTQHIIDCLTHAACSASPNHGLTPLEIQRWEDDGGAILAEPKRQRQRRDWHLHEAPYELAPPNNIGLGIAGSPAEAARFQALRLLTLVLRP